MKIFYGNKSKTKVMNAFATIQLIQIEEKVSYDD